MTKSINRINSFANNRLAPIPIKIFKQGINAVQKWPLKLH